MGGKPKTQAGGAAEGLLLEYEQPYRFDRLLEFYRVRTLAGVEQVDASSYARTACIALPDGKEVRGWIRITDEPDRSALRLTMSESLLPAAEQISARVKRMFDLDCDPRAVHDGLAELDAVRPGANIAGTRLPGCFEPFETCCRAVIGQQVSVAAANRMAARVVETYGTPVETGIAGLDRAFPTPTEILALDDIAGAFGPLGIIRTRSAVIAEIARLVEGGAISFGTDANAPEEMERLLAIKGVGPWTANYIAMRAFSYPDAFLETDAGVKHALPELAPRERLAAAEAWRPWRSYAVICLWNSLG